MSKNTPITANSKSDWLKYMTALFASTAEGIHSKFSRPQGTFSPGDSTGGKSDESDLIYTV